MIRHYTSLALVAAAMIAFSPIVHAQKATGFQTWEFAENVREGHYTLERYEDEVLYDLIWWTDLRFEQIEEEIQTDPASRKIWNTDLLFDPERKVGYYVGQFVEAAKEDRDLISSTDRYLTQDLYRYAATWLVHLFNENKSKTEKIADLETRVMSLEEQLDDLLALGEMVPAN